MVTNDSGKFYLKVEKGRKPRVKLFEELCNAQITIPYDQSIKWPPIRVQMSGGITIIVQRLEQQYKITVQHIMERKPDICVYVNALAHERDIRTCVRDVNTQLNHIGVAGPNLEVTGRIKAIKVTFESTVGALHTNSKLSARSIILKAQHIFIKPEALFTCSKLRMISRRVQIDGRICCSNQMSSKMSIFIDSALLHIGVDGIIGTTRSSTDKSASKLSENLVNVLHFRLTGCLANYGFIGSQNEMEIYIDGSILSLQDSRIDSASRGYSALKQIKGVSSETSDSLPTSSKLSSAILYEKPDTVAQLLEDGVDLNDSIKINDMNDNTPRKIANKKYKTIQASERRNKMREKITLIQALISTHDWKRGVITSNNINAKIGRDCADCAQFRSGTLALTVYGNAKCEAKSIWTGGSVTVTVGHDLIIEGQVKHVNLDVTCGGNMATTEEAIISQEQCVKIISTAFCVAGIWSVGEQFSLDVKSATFLEESYLEVDYFDGTISECCYNSGTWQTRFISLIIQGDLFTLHTGKVFVEETTTIDALSFNNCGLWKIKEAIKMLLKGSANFYASSKFSANLLKIIAQGQCTIAGYLSLENLLIYIRHDMITIPGARINLTVGGTVAVGTFRNDSSWYIDGNLHLHIACFEQSEDAIIFVKDTLTMKFYDKSDERCYGRIVANYLIMNLAKCVRFDGYIRCNQIEISVPYVNESRLIIGGQLEILDGALILKGRSLENFDHASSSTTTLSNILSFITHSYPAFILEGQLKAEAIIAPFLSIRFSTSSYSLLSGMDSIANNAIYRILISCYSLHTQRTSLIDSVPEKNLFPEGILCATTWLHEGQIRFNGEKVYIITDSLINRGRLTSDDKLQNHMREVVVLVENLFHNDAVFSANSIEISGNGKLHNTNRIFANDKMNIRLANFCSESGQKQLECTQPKLLLANNDWNHVIDGHHIEAQRENFDVTISKTCIALDDKFARQIQITARSRLFIDNDIVDSQRNIALIARDAIQLKSRIIVDIFEVTLGAAYITEFAVKNDASIIANELRICGSCKYLTLIIDGELTCETIIVDARIRYVKMIGTGILSCRKSCKIDGDSVILAIRDIRVIELIAAMITLTTDSTLSLSSSNANRKIISIHADNCYLQGRIFVEEKVILKINHGICHISGEIFGTSATSELSLESDNLFIGGTIANIDFLECYIRKKIEHYEKAMIKNVKNIVFEAKFLSIDGKIIDAESLIATGDEITIEGILYQNYQYDNIAYSIFGKKILVDGEIFGTIRLELSGSEITFAGNATNLKFLDIDANLAMIIPRRMKCENFNLIAYSALLDGNFEISQFTVTIQTTLFIRTDLTDCSKCKFIAPLILALNCPMSTSNMHICSLIYIFERFELVYGGKFSKLLSPKQQFFQISTDNSDNSLSKYTSNCNTTTTTTATTAKFSPTRQASTDNIDRLSQCFVEISFHSGIINHYTIKNYDLWRKTMEIIGDCFKNSNTTTAYDEIDEALKSVDQMLSVGISLPTTSSLYLILLKLLNELHIEHILMRNFTKLFHLICNIANNNNNNDNDNDDIDDNDDNEAKYTELFIEQRERFDSQTLHEIINRFRIRPRKFGLQRIEHNSADDDVGYVSRSSSEEIDEKRQNVDDQHDDILYYTNLDKESFRSTSKVTVSDGDDCMDKDTVTDDELRNTEILNDDIHRSQKIEETYDTTYVLNGEKRVPIGYIDFNRLDVIITKPEFLTRRKIPPGNSDLAFKKIQVKASLPTLELISFGSESSLASFDDKTLMHSIPTPMKRSLIPRATISTNSNGMLKKSHTIIKYDT